MSERFDPGAVTRAVRQALAGHAAVALHEPWFRGSEWSYVKECIDTGWVSSVGSYVDRFERDLTAATGAPHAMAVVNGTAALHVCLLLVGVRPGDEVLVPSLTFIATANAVRYCGATPHFVDSEESTLGLDPRALRDYLDGIAERRGGECFNRLTGARIAAVVPMHTFGHPVDMDGLADTAQAYGLPIVEDAAESLGSLYRGRHTGCFGRVAALSFNGNKIVTTGGGGAILTADAELARRAKHLTTTARVPDRWSFLHDEVGFNFRLPNLNAALGCAQLEQLDHFVACKRRLAESYRAALAGVPGVRFVAEAPHTRANYWLNAVIVESGDLADRNALLESLAADGIGARPAWSLMHTLPMFRDAPRMPLGTAERLERSLVNLPSSAWLSPGSAALAPAAATAR